MADGPFCFQESPNQSKEAIAIGQKKKDQNELTKNENENRGQTPAPITYFITLEKYNEIRNVNSELTQATEFLIQADSA